LVFWFKIKKKFKFKFRRVIRFLAKNAKIE
jgi:hypothetical protein